MGGQLSNVRRWLLSLSGCGGAWWIHVLRSRCVVDAWTTIVDSRRQSEGKIGVLQHLIECNRHKADGSEKFTELFSFSEMAGFQANASRRRIPRSYRKASGQLLFVLASRRILFIAHDRWRLERRHVIIWYLGEEWKRITRECSI